MRKLFFLYICGDFLFYFHRILCYSLKKLSYISIL